MLIAIVLNLLFLALLFNMGLFCISSAYRKIVIVVTTLKTGKNRITLCERRFLLYLKFPDLLFILTFVIVKIFLIE